MAQQLDSGKAEWETKMKFCNEKEKSQISDDASQHPHQTVDSRKNPTKSATSTMSSARPRKKLTPEERASCLTLSAIRTACGGGASKKSLRQHRGILEKRLGHHPRPISRRWLSGSNPLDEGCLIPQSALGIKLLGVRGRNFSEMLAGLEFVETGLKKVDCDKRKGFA
ncbi:hypothetical protein BDZ45DRAFT_755568 [Acephala macrosclerotiorum]|nr:hypothetical protein BDZ45DRAFT_755568 [Acephala macrosclerotiorum]